MKGNWYVYSALFLLAVLLIGAIYANVTFPAHAPQGQPNVSVQWLPGTDMNRLVDNDLGKVCYYNEKYIVCLPK